MNLGNVKVKSVIRDSSQLNVRKMHREGTAEDEILKEVMSQSYDKFLCELTDMQVSCELLKHGVNYNNYLYCLFCSC